MQQVFNLSLDSLEDRFKKTKKSLQSTTAFFTTLSDQQILCSKSKVTLDSHYVVHNLTYSVMQDTYLGTCVSSNYFFASLKLLRIKRFRLTLSCNNVLSSPLFYSTMRCPMASTLRCTNRYVAISGMICVQPKHPPPVIEEYKHTYRHAHTHT